MFFGVKINPPGLNGRFLDKSKGYKVFRLIRRKSKIIFLLDGNRTFFPIRRKKLNNELLYYDYYFRNIFLLDGETYFVYSSFLLDGIPCTVTNY